VLGTGAIVAMLSLHSGRMKSLPTGDLV